MQYYTNSLSNVNVTNGNLIITTKNENMAVEIVRLEE
jgi:hypothetical protein